MLQSVVLVTSAWSGRLGQDSSVHWAQCSLGAEVSDHSYLCSNRFSCFPTLQCLHVCPYYGSSWQSVPRHTTVPSHDNVSTQPLATSLPRHLPSVKGSCAYGRLRNCFQTASTSPRARICGRTYGMAYPRRATQPAGRASNAPSSASMASVRAWWKSHACRGCVRKRTAMNRVAQHSSRLTRIAGTCLKGPATISTKHTMPSMPRSRQRLSAAGESRSWRSSQNAPSAR